MKIYRAVVINNNDLSRRGMVQIKINGESDSSTDNENLSWAEVMLPSPGLIGGIGFSSVIKQGTWVYCTKLDETQERYLVLGVCTGIVGEEFVEDFKDPSGTYPLEETKGLSDYGQCSVTIDSLHNKAENEETETSSGASFKYTHTVSPSKYLDSSILRTSSGILIELDDADERIKITHPSGTTIQIDSDGSVTTVAQNDVTLNCKSNVNWNILKDWNLSVDGNVNWNIQGNWTSSVEGKMDYVVQKTVNWKVVDDISWYADKNINWKVTNRVDWNVLGPVSWLIGEGVDWNVGAGVGWKVASSVDWNILSSISFNTALGYSVTTPLKIDFTSSIFNTTSSSGLLSGVNLITSSGKNFESHVHGGVRGGDSVTSTPI